MALRPSLCGAGASFAGLREAGLWGRALATATAGLHLLCSPHPIATWPHRRCRCMSGLCAPSCKASLLIEPHLCAARSQMGAVPEKSLLDPLLSSLRKVFLGSFGVTLVLICSHVHLSPQGVNSSEAKEVSVEPRAAPTAKGTRGLGGAR